MIAKLAWMDILLHVPDIHAIRSRLVYADTMTRRPEHIQNGSSDAEKKVFDEVRDHIETRQFNLQVNR